MRRGSRMKETLEPMRPAVKSGGKEIGHRGSRVANCRSKSIPNLWNGRVGRRWGFEEMLQMVAVPSESCTAQNWLVFSTVRRHVSLEAVCTFFIFMQELWKSRMYQQQTLNYLQHPAIVDGCLDSEHQRWWILLGTCKSGAKSTEKKGKINLRNIFAPVRLHYWEPPIYCSYE